MAIVADSGPARSLTPKAVRTKTSLLTSARCVFNRDGLTEARVIDIVRGAGVSHGTFYTYFTSKQDIFEHVVIEFLEGVRAAVDALSDGKKRTPYDAIYRENLVYIKVLKANARIVGILMMHSLSADDRISSRRRADSAFFTDRAERSIRYFQDQGLAHADVDPPYVARALSCMIEQFCIQWVTEEWDFETEKAARQLTDMWARSIGLGVPEHRG